MNLPVLAPYASNTQHDGDYVAVTIAAVRTGVTLSGKGGGGGGGPQPPPSGVCARSCYDCSVSGWSSCSYNQWCANRYPGSPGVPGLPYGCG
jgi:hypothetical protein